MEALFVRCRWHSKRVAAPSIRWEMLLSVCPISWDIACNFGWADLLTLQMLVLCREKIRLTYIYIYTTYIWVRVALSWPPLMVWSPKYYNIGECSTSTTVSTSSISMYVIVYTSTITNQQYSTITVWGRLENGRPYTNMHMYIYICISMCIYTYIQINLYIYIYVCNISVLCDQTFTMTTNMHCKIQYGWK